MKKLYIQPDTQLQLMNCTSLICASAGGRTVTNNAGLDLVPSPVNDIDPM